MTLIGALPDPSTRLAARERAHAFVRATSPRSGARSCMVEPTAPTVSIALDDDGHAHVGGLKRCASPWACPLCSPRIRQRRADEVTALVAAARGRGGGAVLVTATVPHGADDALVELLDGVQAAWSSLWSGKGSKALKERFGVLGQVRALEITYGVEAGWNPHLHAVLVLDRPPADDLVVALWGALFLRWQQQVQRHLGRRPNAYGIRVDAVDDDRVVADYVTDANGWSIGAEVAAGPVKLGRSSGRWSPFALLMAAACWGDAQAAAVWHEYEVATRGRRAIVASKGLLEAFGVVEESDDDAAVVRVEDPVRVVEVDHAGWLVLVATGRAWIFLKLLERWAAAGYVDRQPEVVDAFVEPVAPMVWRE